MEFNENKPKISVLMSVYNTEFNLVKRALNSVLKQDYQDFELIIIDDGSDRDPKQNLLNFAIEHENKITFLRHKNLSQAMSINKGVKFSSGEYITMIDADDEYKSNHLSMCLKEIQNADLISTKTHTIVDKEDDYYVPDKFNLAKGIHVDDCVLFATLFGKREVFLNTSFNEEYAADANFFESASKRYSVKKVNLRTYIYYRNIPNSITSTIKKQYSRATLKSELYVQSTN
jgi:glycosyltransferase involved in cell wall biosynthesis